MFYSTVRPVPAYFKIFNGLYFRYSSKDPGQRRENNERLVKADYHGCYIVVRKSKCVSLVGQAGIVLMETKHLFKVISKKNKIKSEYSVVETLD